MGLFSKFVTTKLAESVIETVGRVTLNTTVGIMEGKAKNQTIEDKSIDDVPKGKYKTVKKVKTAHSKNDDGKIKPPSIDKLIGEHYLKVRAAFVGGGFEDISYIVKKDIIKGWLRKDGEVSEISISGRTEIGSRTKFLPTAPVVIVYHTFKDAE